MTGKAVSPPPDSSRLLKNAHLPFDRPTALSFAEGLRCAHYSSLRRTQKHALFLIILRVLHLAIFEQPV